MAVLSTRTGSVAVRPLPCSLGEEDVVALPVYRQRSSQALAAVLLRACCWIAWQPQQGASPAQQPHTRHSIENFEFRSNNTATGSARYAAGGAGPAEPMPASCFQLGREDAHALQRVAQMVGFGLFSDHDHSAFLSQVGADAPHAQKHISTVMPEWASSS